MDIQKIQSLLPHRYPFLLVDRIEELEEGKLVAGYKNVTINEPFFQGHFPEHPIMPGVLQLEAMAQLAGVLLLRKLENTGKLAVLWSIDKVKLRGSVVPGDQLRIEVETVRMKGETAQVRGMGTVGGKLVCEATLMFTMLVAAEKPPRNASMVSKVCSPCMGRASTKASPLNSPGGSILSPAIVIGITKEEKNSR